MDKRNSGTGNPAAPLLILLSHSRKSQLHSNYWHTFMCLPIYRYAYMFAVVYVHAHPRVPKRVYVQRKIKSTFKEKQEKKMVFFRIRRSGFVSGS